MTKQTRGFTDAPRAPQIFGNAGKEYMEKYGAEAGDFAEIARINHLHSVKNPYSQFQDVYTKQQILDSPTIFGPLTKLQCCPTSDGAAAAVLVSQKWLDAHPELKNQAILIAGQALATDSPNLFNRSSIELVGADMTRKAAQTAMAEAGIKPSEVKVCELHDCFSANEMVTIDCLGLSAPGKAHEMVRKGDITFGGKVVINPSGGLISKGHPLGATGLAQCAELCWHLRGQAVNREVMDVSCALQHNLGLGGACVVTVYKRADGKTNTQATQNLPSKMGYNAAVEYRGVTAQEAKKAISQVSSSDWMQPQANL